MLAFAAAFLANAAPQSASSGDSYLIGPNDRILVRCLHADEFGTTPVRIDSDGSVTLPFVGRFHMGGMTVAAAEKELASELTRYLVNPQVYINVVESHSQPVSVLGAVNNPGAYQLEGVKTLSEVLSMAGGLRRDAGQTLELTRRAEYGPIPLPGSSKDPTGKFNVASVEIDEFIRGNSPAANISLRPNDVISVPQADLIYVVGQVHKPGGYTLTGREGLTVLKALSMAEGLDRTALTKKARIIRKQGDATREDIPVNLDDILAGRATDIRLQADDVLFVPNSTFKSVGMKAIDAAIQLTTGIIIYGKL